MFPDFTINFRMRVHLLICLILEWTAEPSTQKNY